MTTMRNVFSVDVEDYFHVQAFAGQVNRRQWNQFESRVVPNTHRILNLLEAHQVRGVFFILGWVAERYPQLVRDIQKGGHEIGCHSYWHRLVYSQSPDEFRVDLVRATAVLSDITGEAITAYRAPCFSVTKDSLWALDILIEEGYQIDSSVFPVRHDTYGVPGAKVYPHRLYRENGSLLEFPPAVRQKWFGNIPVGGGGYFRIFPYLLSQHWLANVNRKEHRPFIFYIHPWEVDPEQPRIPTSLKSRFRHYRNLHNTEYKLDRLFKAFDFQSLSQFAESQVEDQHQSPMTDTAKLIDTVSDATVRTSVMNHSAK